MLNRNKLEPADARLTTSQLATIVDMLQENQLNIHYARRVLQELLDQRDRAEGRATSPSCPREIVTANNWFLITDESDIRRYCEGVIERSPKLVDKYRKGKEKMLYALAGEVAKASEEKVDMARAVEMLKEMLK